MPQNDLSDTEKSVLFGLVNSPNATDSELAKNMSMKTSTVAAVRRKLYRESYCASRVVPFMQDLDCEMIMISYMTLSSSPSIEERLEKPKKVLSREEFIYGISEPRQDFLLQMSRNYTSAKRNIEDLEQVYRENGYLEEEVVSVSIPFQLSSIHRYFDYDLLLHSDFWPDAEYKTDERLFFQPTRPIRLRNKEKAIYCGMCEYPLLNDVELSDKLGVSRMTVGRARKKFFDLGILSRKVIPDITKLGFELLTFTHGKFNADLTEGLKHYLPKLAEVIGPTVFLASTRDEMITISAFRNFTEYRSSMNRFAETYKEKELFSSPANVRLFSTREIKAVRDHEYGAFARKTLGLA